MYRIEQNLPAGLTRTLPASKSVSHRVAILAALNSGETRIGGILPAEDTEITLQALLNMGMSAAREKQLLICRKPIGLVRTPEIYLGNSGSSARFLLPLGTLLDQPFKFFGDERLHRRPFTGLFEALKQLGGKFDCQDNGLPATIYPGGLSGGTVRFQNLPSSQMVTALMMAGTCMDADLRIELPPDTPSLPYIQMTYRLMRRLGLAVTFDGDVIQVAARRPNFQWNYSVERDFSAASYWVVLALINDIPVTLNGMTVPSLQGDEAILEIAELAGGNVMLYDDRLQIEGRISQGLTIDCLNIPDLVPALSVLGMFAPEPVILKNVQHLRHKESDRIAAIQANIAALGGASEYHHQTLRILPASHYQGTRLDSFQDHRIAMSFAVAGTRIPGTVIDHPACVRKSYPEFWSDFPWWQEVKESA